MFVKRKKDKLIQIRVTTTEKEIIKILSDRKGMTISEFILYLVDHHMVLHGLMSLKYDRDYIFEEDE